MNAFNLRDAYFRRAVPMPPHMRRAFHFAVVLARWAGATFPLGHVAVWAFTGQPHEKWGFTFDRLRPIEVFLNTRWADRAVVEWTHLILHELGHALDAPLNPGFDEGEARADAFADRAMEEWPRLAQIALTIGVTPEELGA